MAESQNMFGDLEHYRLHLNQVIFLHVSQEANEDDYIHKEMQILYYNSPYKHPESGHPICGLY